MKLAELAGCGCCLAPTKGYGSTRGEKEEECIVHAHYRALCVHKQYARANVTLVMMLPLNYIVTSQLWAQLLLLFIIILLNRCATWFRSTSGMVQLAIML